MTAADHDRLLGLVLEGRYQVQALLGKGGMGRVYLAEERLLHRPCAIKLLPREHCENATNVERFLREAQVIARVRHENIVDIYSFGQDPDGEVFYAMELLSGQDLEARLRDATRGLPDWRELCGWSVQICRALAAVHDAGFVHRDIKPGNLFLTRRSDGSALIKLLDFGIARPEESELTSTGAFLGTLPYMSPEQVQARPLDGRSDIYALGILLYRAVAGRPPFRGDPVHVVQQHVRDPPPPLLPLAPDRPLPVELLDIIDRCLRKSRDERFQSMREVEVALSTLLAQQDPPLASPAAPASLPPMETPPESTDASTHVQAAGAKAAASAAAQRSEADPSQSALLTTRHPAAHELAPRPLKPADPSTLAPDDSLVVPRRRFGNPRPDDPSFIAPSADLPLPAKTSSETEKSPVPTPPTHALDLSHLPGSHNIRRRLSMMALVPTSLLALLLVLRSWPWEREPASPPIRAAVHHPLVPPAPPDLGSGASSTAELVDQWLVPEHVDSPDAPPVDTSELVDSPPGDAPPGDAPPGDAPQIATEAPRTPELSPQGASPPLSASRPSPTRRTGRTGPPSLAQKGRRCRREHGGTGLPPIVVEYTLSNGKVLRARTITAVSPELAVCLEAVLRNTPFPPEEFGIAMRISL